MTELASSVVRRSSRYIVAVFALTIATANANLLTNGSFESNPGTNGVGYYNLQPGDTRITGWTVYGGPIDCVGT